MFLFRSKTLIRAFVCLVVRIQNLVISAYFSLQLSTAFIQSGIWWMSNALYPRPQSTEQEVC
jgi:hypothetical protein